jgi:hypothetical protein
MKNALFACMVFLAECMWDGAGPACGQGILTSRDLLPEVPEEVPGSRVPTSREAACLATDAYMERTGGLSADESFDGPRLFFLGFDMDGFAKSGDKIWEVRITTLMPSARVALRAIAWVNPDTAQVHFVCGPWE